MTQANAGDVLTVDSVSKSFGRSLMRHRILENVSFSIAEHSAVGLIGESGSGKSTMAKIIVGMYSFDAGRIAISNQEMLPGRRYSSSIRSAVSYIPQDPFSSFDPRRTIGQSLVEAVNPRSGRVGKYEAVLRQWLERVGLPEDSLKRYPHEFSGGQRQRLAIARGLSTSPQLVIADEITSALDMSVQAQILRLLDELRKEHPFAMLFISHNLAVVQSVCEQVMVMKGGVIVERGQTRDVLSKPTNSYTKRLLDSIPGSPSFSLAEEVDYA